MRSHSRQVFIAQGSTRRGQRKKNLPLPARKKFLLDFHSNTETRHPQTKRSSTMCPHWPHVRKRSPLLLTGNREALSPNKIEEKHIFSHICAARPVISSPHCPAKKSSRSGSWTWAKTLLETKLDSISAGEREQERRRIFELCRGGKLQIAKVATHLISCRLSCNPSILSRTQESWCAI